MFEASWDDQMTFEYALCDIIAIAKTVWCAGRHALCEIIAKKVWYTERHALCETRTIASKRWTVSKDAAAKPNIFSRTSNNLSLHTLSGVPGGSKCSSSSGGVIGAKASASDGVLGGGPSGVRGVIGEVPAGLPCVRLATSFSSLKANRKDPGRPEHRWQERPRYQRQASDSWTTGIWSKRSSRQNCKQEAPRNHLRTSAGCSTA